MRTTTSFDIPVSPVVPLTLTNKACSLLLCIAFSGQIAINGEPCPGIRYLEAFLDKAINNQTLCNTYLDGNVITLPKDDDLTEYGDVGTGGDAIASTTFTTFALPESTDTNSVHASGVLTLDDPCTNHKR